jgi:hypothetical protein
MASIAEEAVVEYAGVDFRSGLDGAPHDDGGSRMAGLAAVLNFTLWQLNP